MNKSYMKTLKNICYKLKWVIVVQLVAHDSNNTNIMEYDLIKKSKQKYNVF